MEAFDNGTLNAENKDTVSGGGDTAMDCVRTAIRQKAKSVSCLYRRDRVNMPGSQREVQNAEEEGVVFKWLSAPQSFLGDVKVRAVQAHVFIWVPDATGRQVPEVIEGSTHEMPADMVIKALGFDPEDLYVRQKRARGDPLGNVENRLANNDDKSEWCVCRRRYCARCFSGGLGVRDGRDAAEAIDKWITAAADVPRAAGVGR